MGTSDRLNSLKNMLIGAFDSSARRNHIADTLRAMASRPLAPSHPRFLNKTDSLMAYAIRNPDELGSVLLAVNNIGDALHKSHGIRASGYFLLKARQFLINRKLESSGMRINCAISDIGKKFSDLLVADIAGSKSEHEKDARLISWISRYDTEDQNVTDAVCSAIIKLCKQDTDLSNDTKLYALRFVGDHWTESLHLINAITITDSLVSKFQSAHDAEGTLAAADFIMTASNSLENISPGSFDHSIGDSIKERVLRM